MLTVENISKTYGEKPLFEDISFSILDGQRIGLIGINGTGKSTLLKIISGLEVPDTGGMMRSKDYTVSYLSQNPDFDENLTVLEQVFMGETPLLKVLREYENILLKLDEEPENEKIQQQLYSAQHQMDALNAWDSSANIKSMLSKLGINQLTAKMSELSGGQKKRVAMASCFVQSPSLLILDEPTNHLDTETVEWLENYLARYTGALLFVTHDRYFLDRVTNRIIELDNGKLYSYDGNYSTFLEGKALREEQEMSSEQKRQNLFQRELAWMRRGAKARTTKQKARIQRFDELEKQDGPTSKQQVDISIGGSRLGKKVVEFKDVYKKFEGKTILEGFNRLIKPGDRIGIIGANGSGKSTLLNILSGKVEPDSGEVEVGQTVKIAYYTQENEEMDMNQRMLDYIKEVAEVIHTLDGKTISASQMLERFLFSTSMHGTPIRKLSGGERRRLYLLRILMGEPNVLILDEPTNDLDTQTLTVLEDYLESFPGVVITVSHDRYFLDKVVEELLVFNGEGDIGAYYGSYSDYLDTKKSEQQEQVIKMESIVEKPKVKKKKLSYNEQREWDSIEGDIAKVEEELEELGTKLETIGSDYEEAQKIMDKQRELEVLLENKMTRWEELSELVESLEG